MTNNKGRKLLQSEVRFDLSRSLQSSRPEKVFLKYFSSSRIEKTKNKEDQDMRIFETFLIKHNSFVNNKKFQQYFT